MRPLLSLALRAFPRAFRERFGAGMLEVMLADYDRTRARGRARALVFVVATVVDALVEGVCERVEATWIDPEARARARRWQVKAMLEAWKLDFVFAARSLARAPGFTFVVVLTLALAIGANAAIFSVVEAVLLKPLPYPNADRLVHIVGTAPGTDMPERFGVPDELYFEYRESVPALEDLGLYGTGSSTTRAEDQVEQLFFTRATPSFFTTLGARPLLGRLPTEEDSDDVVVLGNVSGELEVELD